MIKASLENVPTILQYIMESPVVLPTDTFYSLSAPIIRKDLFDRVYQLKGIRMESSSPIGFYGLRDMEKYCSLDEGAKRIVKRFMPGPLTIILEAKIKGHWVISNKIGARIPDNQLTREVIREVGPITLVGANIRGFKGATNIQESIAQFGENVPLYVDAGNLPGIPSTIYDYTNKNIIREGGITLKDIRRAEGGI